MYLGSDVVFSRSLLEIQFNRVFWEKFLSTFKLLNELLHLVYLVDPIKWRVFFRTLYDFVKMRCEHFRCMDFRK